MTVRAVAKSLDQSIAARSQIEPAGGLSMNRGLPGLELALEVPAAVPSIGLPAETALAGMSPVPLTSSA
jgi:hypothetical protein